MVSPVENCLQGLLYFYLKFTLSTTPSANYMKIFKPTGTHLRRYLVPEHPPSQAKVGQRGAYHFEAGLFIDL